MTEPFCSLLDRLRTRVSDGRRTLLGLAGPPGSGKSTLAERLARALAPDAALAPMDGFHLAGAELDRLGRHGRKGAADTFDAAGYVALLRRLRDRTDPVVYAPRFDRTLDEPIAAAIAVAAEVPLVITEDNYMLLDEQPWRAVRGLLDEVWYLDVDAATRRDRLTARHIRHGRTPAEAAAWVRTVDTPNAALVETTRPHATTVIPAQ